MNRTAVPIQKWMSRLLTITVLLLNVVGVVQAQHNPYGPVLPNLWDKGLRLEEQGDYAGAEKVYQEALQVSYQLPDSLVKRCAIAMSRVGLESMTAVQKIISEQGYDAEGVEITLIQQYYATWEQVGSELKLSSGDCSFRK